MGKVALPFLKDGLEQAKAYGKSEALKMAHTATMLADGVRKGKVDLDEAKFVLEMQKNASKSILLTIKGLGIVSVENAINGAMGVLRKSIETAFGVAL
jgi:hypothetical protein